MTLAADPNVLAASAEAIRHGSASFAAASRLFSAHTRESAVMLYAWCRHCDDVIDGQSLGHGQVDGDRDDAAERLAMLRSAALRACRGGEAPDHVHAALAAVVKRHAIPERYPLELLEGFRMDVEGARYASLDDTLRYCYHVAGTVGVMMAMVMGVRDERLLDRACDLGIAFQLTNIARDVVEDAAIGRVYLPADWLSQAGVPTESLQDPAHRAALATVVARLLDAAEPYYASARIGTRALPLRSAWAVAAAHGIYRDIGTRVRALGPAAWDVRTRTSGARKLARVGTGLLHGIVPGLGVVDRPTHLWTRPRTALTQPR